MRFTLPNPFRKPEADELARRDLEEAKRNLLAHHSAAEYHANLVDYYEAKIVRLEYYLKVPDADCTRGLSR